MARKSHLRHDGIATMTDNMQKMRAWAWVLASFVIIALLSTYPLAVAIANYRPLWWLIGLAFWLARGTIGFGTAFVVGLTFDFLLDNHLGQQALCATLMALAASFVHSRTVVESMMRAWLGLGLLLVGIVLLEVLHFLGAGLLPWQMLFATLVVWAILWQWRALWH